MTSTPDLLELVYEALTASGDTTAAGEQVFKPGDWPTWTGQFPVLKLRVPNEDRQQIGRGTVEFTTVATIQVFAMVSAPAAVNDGGAAVAEAALWALKRQVEVAIIGSLPLTNEISMFPFVRSELTYTSEGETHLAGLTMSIGLEFYEGPEDFAPVASALLNEVRVTASNFPGAGVDIDTTDA